MRLYRWNRAGGLVRSPGYLANLVYVIGYLLKGSDEITSQALNLDEYGIGGSIVGKRIAISSNLR